MKKQSAFSLIEVLVTLLILSIVVVGTSKLLLKSTLCYQKAELHELTTTMVWSIAEDLYLDGRGERLVPITRLWQEKLEAIFPGSLLTIQPQTVEEQWGYHVTIQFATPLIRPIEFWVALKARV